MALYDNQITALYTPSQDLTGAVTAAVSAGKFLKVSANFASGPLLSTGTDGGNIQVATCAAGAKAIGVSKWDAPTAGDKVGIFTGGQVVPMTAGAAITADQEVESDASGNPIPLATGKSNGKAISGAALGATVYIKLYV